MSKTSGDVSEVVFDQPEEKVGAMEPDGLVPNRRKEEEWLEATEPYHGARPRITEFDRPVDEGLGATLGGKGENVNLRDIVVPRLQPERQIRQEEEVQTENRFLRTPMAKVPVPLVRQAALTMTKVPWFNGTTSWEQYQQVFDAILLSNGWGDVTAALQLLSHLQDDALSVTLLIPMPLRASRKELTDALSSHYG